MLEWVEQSVQRRDWPAVLKRLELAEAIVSGTADRIDARRALAYARLGDRTAAEGAVLQGRRRCGDTYLLNRTWADVAFWDADHAVAVSRYQELLADHDEHAQPEVFLRLAESLSAIGSRSASCRAVDEGLGRYPSSRPLLRRKADLAVMNQDWAVAVTVLEALVSDDNDPKMLLSLARALKLSGDYRSAAAWLDVGRTHYPTNAALVRESAELAFVEESWSSSLRCWRLWLGLETAGDGEAPILPIEGQDGRWNRMYWARLFGEIRSGNIELGDMGPDQSLAFADVLERGGFLPEAVWLLGQAGDRLPDPRVGIRLEILRLELARPGPGEPALIESASLTALGSDPEVSGLMERLVAEAVPARSSDAGLPELSVLQVSRDSRLEAMVRSTWFLTADSAAARIADLSERDNWPELTGGLEAVARRARAVGRLFGKAYGAQLDLPTDVLSECLHLPVYLELCRWEPMRRLAREIRSLVGAGPVFVDLPSVEVSYFEAFGRSDIDQLYLYLHLRQLGVNAVLVATVRRSKSFGAITVKPPTSMFRECPGADLSAGDDCGTVAVMPGLMRAVGEIVQRIPPSIVYGAGPVLPQRSYGSTATEQLSGMAGGLGPQRDLLPTFTVELSPVDSAADIGSQGSVLRSAPLGGDWLEWTERILGDFIADYRRRCEAEVRARGLRAVHTADHLSLEARLMAHEVKRQGGAVTLWPHSTAPIDVVNRRPKSFDEVNAVTAAGADIWRDTHRETLVGHSPWVMLDDPQPQPIDDASPLSVVVIGGKNHIGMMPFVRMSAHTTAYRELFEGLRRLQAQMSIDVYFKPKGRGVEDEVWLESVMGGHDGWQVEQAHPSSIDLPNMLFVSISVGSSALLEGVARGIPCLILEGAGAGEYTTISHRMMPRLGSSDALKVIAECARPAALRTLLAGQRSEFCRETTISFPAE